MKICTTDFLGPWAIRPEYARHYLSVWKRGGEIAAWSTLEPAPHPKNQQAKPYAVTQNGIAVLSVTGPMMKNPPYKMAESMTSTIDVQRLLGAAENDPDVRAILLRVDSPGGKVPGTDELAMAVRSAAEQKPLVTFAEDTMASAAAWVGLQADEVFINRGGSAGSLGVFGVVYDTSGAFEAEGIKVHLISTGGVKGVGADGVPVTEPYLADLQAEVDAIGAMFKEAVKAGRGGKGKRMTSSQVDAVFDGRMFRAEQAVELGLVDKIGTIQDALKRADQLASEKESKVKAMQNRMRMAGAGQK